MLLSCNAKKEHYSDIGVVYYPGMPDFSISPDRNSFISHFSPTDDTILISREDYNQITGYAKTGIIDTISDYDARICLNINGKYYFIRNNTTTDTIAQYAHYFIKDIIGYYNHIEERDLQSLIEIKTYGVPKDYYEITDTVIKPKKQMVSIVLKAK